MSKRYLEAALAAILTASLATAGTVPSEPFSDSFEGKQIYPYWALTNEFGTVALSTSESYEGLHSLGFSSAPGGERTMIASHKFAQQTKGTVSVAFYDTAPGQQTLYEYLEISDSTSPTHNVHVGTTDFDANCYSASVGSTGPDANCGIYPQTQTTPVKRSLGWHIFSITYNASSVSIAIDGTVIFTTPVNYTFDTVQLVVAGPSYRPDTSAYFDDFTFSPPWS